MSKQYLKMGYVHVNLIRLGVVAVSSAICYSLNHCCKVSKGNSIVL